MSLLILAALLGAVTSLKAAHAAAKSAKPATAPVPVLSREGEARARSTRNS